MYFSSEDDFDRSCIIAREVCRARDSHTLREGERRGRGGESESGAQVSRLVLVSCFGRWESRGEGRGRDSLWHEPSELGRDSLLGSEAEIYRVEREKRERESE